MGRVTKGGCAKICTHHRKPIAGGRPVANGIATNDIASQITGPYTNATATAPAG